VQPKVSLEAVRIDGFRSCDGTAFSPHPQLSVLIGPNGSGKTNILQGIALLAAWLTPTAAQAERAGRQAAADTQVTAAFQVGAEALALRATVRLRGNAAPAESVIALKDEWREGGLPGANARGWVEIPFSFLLQARKIGPAATRTRSGTGPLDIPLTVPFMQFYAQHQTPAERITAFRQRIRYYSASQFTDPSQCPSTLEIDPDDLPGAVTPAGRGHRQFLVDLYQLHQTDPARYAAYLGLVGPRGLKLLTSIQWKGGPTGDERTWVRPTVRRDADRLGFNQLSEGTFRSLALVFYLMADDSDLLLLEEPEVGVHRGLLVSLLELIRSQSRHKQILVSTHSDFVLDTVQPENVFAVTRGSRGKTAVRALADGYSAQEMAALREYLRTEGSLGEYWRHFGLES
jgi:hypothetical protein